MYGCHVVPPNDDGADLGVVFFHNEGYSTACGHGTIALVTWALDEGVVDRREGENRVVVDVPSGRLETWAQVEGGRVCSVRFRNVPSFVWARGPRGGRPDRRRRLRRRVLRVARGAGRAPRAAPARRARRRDQGRPRGGPRVVHPVEPELRDVYGVIFWQQEGDGPHAAERHRLRGRRGRPLAVWKRNLGAARPAARRGAARPATSCATSRSSTPSSAAGSSRRPRWRGGRRS